MTTDLMNSLTAWIAFVAGLSVATERVTEIVKGYWGRVAFEREDDPKAEEKRKARIQILAIVVGAGLSFITYQQIQPALKLPVDTWSRVAVCVVFGAMASGGSGLWNSALDIVREANKQKQVLTDKLKGR